MAKTIRHFIKDKNYDFRFNAPLYRFAVFEFGRFLIILKLKFILLLTQVAGYEINDRFYRRVAEIAQRKTKTLSFSALSPRLCGKKS
jgi:hypothetical protein